MERERKLRSFFIHLIRIYLSQYTYREMSAEMHMGNRTLQRMRRKDGIATLIPQGAAVQHGDAGSPHLDGELDTDGKGNT